jgi:hypothetical protein
MKIFINNPGEDWICDRIRSEFIENNKDICVSFIEEADTVWVISPWMFQDYEKLKGKKSIFSIYHIVPSKFDKQNFELINFFATSIHTICDSTKEFLKDHTEKPISTIPFWVNQEIWKNLDKKKCREELNLPVDKYIVGSFQRDTEGHDLISPKLEKGPDQFCDIVESIYNKNKNTHVLLGGWRRQYIISRLESKNIPFTYFEKPDFDFVNKMYNSLDLYVVSSRNEGGPQSIPESCITKTPIISTDVGCAKIFLNKSSIYTFPDFESASPDIEHGSTIVQDYLIPKGFESFHKMFNES